MPKKEKLLLFIPFPSPTNHLQNGKATKKKLKKKINEKTKRRWQQSTNNKKMKEKDENSIKNEKELTHIHTQKFYKTVEYILLNYYPLKPTQHIYCVSIALSLVVALCSDCDVSLKEKQ